MKTTITNQEIIDIVENNDATNRLNYNAVRSVADAAQDKTTTQVKKTIHHWNSSDYRKFCSNVRTLLK